MKSPDDIATINQRHWENAVRAGEDFTRPWLGLDVAALRAFEEGRTDVLPSLCSDDPIERLVMRDVRGKDVLCLASGGGQQSAVLALLGARVTVVDLVEGQLEGDRKAAAHYGYDVTTIQADMRNLGGLTGASFDLVYQAPSMCFIPDVRDVFAEVARVLRPGGRYRVEFTNPAVEFMSWESWDGQGYRITVPYAERVERPEKEDDSIQFRHYLRDVFNGLLAEGFAIERVEDTYCGMPDLNAMPGTWAHWAAYFPCFVVLARGNPPQSGSKTL